VFLGTPQGREEVAKDVIDFAARVNGTGRTRWDAKKIGEEVREPNPAGTGAAFTRTGEPPRAPREEGGHSARGER
jgi:hypothetical protein